VKSVVNIAVIPDVKLSILNTACTLTRPPLSPRLRQKSDRRSTP
jgi:hypothetical protein